MVFYSFEFVLMGKIKNEMIELKFVEYVDILGKLFEEFYFFEDILVIVVIWDDKLFIFRGSI